jgi:hypothetical protein
MNLTDRQFNAVKKATMAIALKRSQAFVWSLTESIIDPELTWEIKKRSPIYLSLYAWIYYRLCIEGTGLGMEDAVNYFRLLIIRDQQGEKDDPITITMADRNEAIKLKDTYPKVAIYLHNQAQKDFQGEDQNFYVTLQRAFEIETAEKERDNEKNIVECPFCTQEIIISKILKKTAFRCPCCNKVFNVQP